MFYAAYGTEIIRTDRVTSSKIVSINHCAVLFFTMFDSGGNVNTISKTLSKTFGWHFETFRKLFVTSQFVEFAFKITTLDCFDLDRLFSTLAVLIPFDY